MRKKHKKELIIILILSMLVVFETALLLKFRLKKTEVAIKPEKKISGRLAIIVDDWGYSLSTINFLKEIDAPIDISVLPFLPYSKEIAQIANSNHKEVMLHLPLEPHPNDKIRLEKNVILASMQKKEVLKILNDALMDVPNVKGINNHMGSLATEKKDLMAVIFSEMKKKKLFFVDSLVTSKSVCFDLAKELKVKFAKRNVFLDNKNDAEYIRKQFSYLIKRAKNQGFAIGIGHDHPLTLKVIQEIIPEIENQGIEIVFVSELVK